MPEQDQTGAVTPETPGAFEAPETALPEPEPQVDLPVQPQAAGAVGVALAPTVLIGVGGTGVECLRRAKKRLTDRLGPLEMIRFVYIDTDTNAFLPRMGLAEVERAEQCFIGGSPIEPLITNPQLHKWVLDDVPPPGLKREYLERVAKGKGCGQIRVSGHITAAVCNSMIRDKIHDQMVEAERLSTSLRERLRLQGMAADEALPAIYVVGSLAGGTGSGTYLAVSLIARKLRPRAQMTGIFVLPEVFDEKLKTEEDQKRLVRANAYAALREIQIMQDAHPDFTLEIKTDDRGGVVSLPGGSCLYEACYLLDIKNEDGRRLSKSEDVFEMISLLLLHECGTSFGVQARSAQMNSGRLRGEEVCPQTGEPLRLSTFSDSALGFPVERLLKYCTWSTLRELLESEVLKPVPNASEREKDVSIFLSGHDLDETGPTDQVQDRLLFDATRGGKVSSSSVGVDPSFGARMDPEEFARKLREQYKLFEDRALPEASRLVEQNSVFYLGRLSEPQHPLRDWLEDFLGSCLERRGVPGTAEILEALRSKIEALRREMTDETGQWTSVSKKANEDALDRNLALLCGMSAIKRALSKKDEKYKADSILAVNALIDGELGSKARVAAVRIYDQLQSMIHERIARVAKLNTEARALQSGLGHGIEALVAEAGRATTDFVTFMDVTGPAYLKEYYAGVRIAPSEPLAQAMSQRGMTAPQYFLSLLGLDRGGLQHEFNGRIALRYQPAIHQLDVVKYIAGADQRAVRVKLEEMFKMCQPFWLTHFPAAGARFEDRAYLGCQTDAEGHYPPEVQAWRQELLRTRGHEISQPPDLTPTGRPYQIELVRYTHGARAYYLDDVAAWKVEYDSRLKKPNFPLHLVKSLEDIPDLFPDESAMARQAFALGMAFGFISKRGEYYYANLERTQGKDGGNRYEVPCNTEWQTIFGPAEARQVPSETGNLVFTFDKKKPPEAHKLDQGRAAALNALKSEPEFVAAILHAVEDYFVAVGTVAAKARLDAYVVFLKQVQTNQEALQHQIVEERKLIEGFVKEHE